MKSQDVDLEIQKGSNDDCVEMNEEIVETCSKRKLTFI